MYENKKGHMVLNDFAVTEGGGELGRAVISEIKDSVIVFQWPKADPLPSILFIAPTLRLAPTDPEQLSEPPEAEDDVYHLHQQMYANFIVYMEAHPDGQQWALDLKHQPRPYKAQNCQRLFKSDSTWFILALYCH